MRRLIQRLVFLLLIFLLISVSSLLGVVMACRPPKIVSVTRSPETPNYDQAVTIVAQVIPRDADIKSVILKYTFDCDSWIKVTMNLVGEVYVAEIPPQPYNTIVSYKVYAYDIHGHYSYSEYYSYVVCDFVPPVISNILQVPTSPMPGEPVTVSATVTEPPEASGVKNVILWYKTNGIWSCLDMAMQNGVWSATIPGQSEGVTVKFYVEAFDNKGNSATTSIFEYIVITPNNPPIADFTESASTVYTNEVIDFDASGSYDPDGTIVSYHWDFGDGATGSGISVQHAYSEDGTYVVTLTVTDDDGASDTASSTITVLNQVPVASFTKSAETVYVDDVVTFTSNSYDPDGSIVSYSWNFGDGNTGTGASIQHSYSQAGTFTVTLTVTDDDGATDTASTTITVLNQVPVASFTKTVETVYVGGVITFDASGSYDPDGTIVLYHWDFGDGATGTGVSVQHAFSQAGTYTVTLTVTDDDGATDTATATITVLPKPVPNQNPIASFTASAETVYVGDVIIFVSGSYDPDGYITSYFWDFGDATTGTGASTQHIYSQAGTFTVTLTVTDDDGATDTADTTITILPQAVPNQVPVASFTKSAETVLSGESISFDASESHDPDGTIVSYHWDFGDGATGTGVSVQHSYSQDGTYTVTLTVTDDDGATDTATATITVLPQVVPNQNPVASFTKSAETVYVGDAVSFDASGSYDPDGSIVSYSWDFGDGNTGTGVSVQHAYSQSGTFTVTLTVTDDDGATDTTSTTITVLPQVVPNQNPVASFTESAKTVYVGGVITFDASGSYDPDGSIVSYSWNFGDGATGSGVSVQHPYSQAGVFTVTLTVTDDDGATDTASATKTVLPKPDLNQNPIASFTESASTVYTGEVIDFDASDSYDPDGYVVTYSWNFGDGTTGTGVTVSHAYANNGSYNVTLTATDNEGGIGSANATKTVLNRQPVASFTETAETVDTDETISFDASESRDPDGTIVSYRWNFGDGNTGTGVSVQHAYSQAGSFTVTLTVTDDDGATATTSATKTVLNQSPVASFTASAETVLSGEAITFNASESHDPDGTIVSYFWDFDDETTETGVSVHHSYSQDGTFTVTLTVTDDDGATDTASVTITVLNQNPIASFTKSAETVHVDDVIVFDAAESYDPDGYIASYFWDFGDGTTGTGASIQHVYSQAGTYTVTFTVTDDDGATDTTSTTITVLPKIGLNQSPVASFTESAETVLSGEVISFDASGSYDPDGTIISQLWDFGDGNTAVGVKVEHAYEDNGIYTVTLTVIDNDAATDSTTSTKTVLNRPPIASFTANPTIARKGETVYFDAFGSYDPDGTIVEYFWDFGDGTNATGVVSTHAYSENGNYTVTLTVTDDDEASSSLDAVKIVEKVEMETTNGVLPLAILAAIALGATALTATLLYGLFRRRKKNRKNTQKP